MNEKKNFFCPLVIWTIIIFLKDKESKVKQAAKKTRGIREYRNKLLRTKTYR
jgi:hypothetical protein